MSKEIQCQIVGRGTPSCLHDSVIYQPDFEGVQTPFQANEPVWEGGRSNRVIGLLNNFSAPYSYLHFLNFMPDNPVSINLKIKFIFSQITTFNQQLVRSIVDSDPWNNALIYIDSQGRIRGRITQSDSTFIFVGLYQGVIGEKYSVHLYTEGNNLFFNVNGNEESASFDGTIFPGSGDLFICNPADSQFFLGQVWDFEVDNVQVPIDEGQGTDIHDSIGNVVGNVETTDLDSFWSGRVRNENGLTYSDDYSGVDLDPMPVLHYQNAAENTCKNSNDATTWARNANPKTPITFDQIGLTREINSASLFSDLDDSGAEFGQSVSVFDGGPSGSVHTSKCWIKKDNDISRTVGVRFVLGGGTTQRMTVCINTQTGEAALQSPDSGNYKVVDAGEWWIILSENISQGDHINIQIVVYPAHGVSIGVMDGSAQGSCIMGNSEFHQFKTIEEVENLGPIFTDGSAISTDRTISSFDGANFSNQAMGLYCEIFPVDGLIIGEFLGFDITDFYLVDDQANHISLSAIMDQINSVGIVVQGNQMNINVNGTWAADTTYSGILQIFSGIIELFFDNLYPSRIRELLIFNGGSFSELKGKIDELML